MSKEDELYQKYQSTQQKLKELAIMSESIERNYQALLKNLDLTPQELKSYMENPNNFTPIEWEDLQKEKEKMDEMLKLQLTTVCDPRKTKKKYAEKARVRQNWIFVR